MATTHGTAEFFVGETRRIGASFKAEAERLGVNISDITDSVESGSMSVVSDSTSDSKWLGYVTSSTAGISVLKLLADTDGDAEFIIAISVTWKALPTG